MIEYWLVPSLVGFLQKYFVNVAQNNVKISLWSGYLTLQNLEINSEMLKEAFPFPVEVLSGRVYEFHLEIPWSRINSKPIIVEINTLELILRSVLDTRMFEGTEETSEVEIRTKLLDPTQIRDSKDNDGNDDDDDADRRNSHGIDEDVKSTIFNRLLHNIKLICNNVMIKFFHEDFLVTVTMENFSLDTVNSEWVPEFTEILTEDNVYLMRKLITVRALTICFDLANEGLAKPFISCQHLESRYLKHYVLKKSQTDNIGPLNLFTLKIHMHLPSMDVTVNSNQIIMIKELHKFIKDLYKLLERLSTKVPKEAELNPANAESQDRKPLFWAFVDQVLLRFFAKSQSKDNLSIKDRKSLEQKLCHSSISLDFFVDFIHIKFEFPKPKGGDPVNQANNGASSASLPDQLQMIIEEFYAKNRISKVFHWSNLVIGCSSINFTESPEISNLPSQKMVSFFQTSTRNRNTTYQRNSLFDARSYGEKEKCIKGYPDIETYLEDVKSENLSQFESAVLIDIIYAKHRQELEENENRGSLPIVHESDSFPSLIPPQDLYVRIFVDSASVMYNDKLHKFIEETKKLSVPVVILLKEESLQKESILSGQCEILLRNIKAEIFMPTDHVELEGRKSIPLLNLSLNFDNYDLRGSFNIAITHHQ